MRTLLKLALRNVLGAGLRTGLNVAVLSMAFVAIVFLQGLIRGMNDQTERSMIAEEIGGGQLWHPKYDPYDPLELADAHGPVPPAAAAREAEGRTAPVLVVQGTIYPHGRLIPALVKGIDPGQRSLDLPTGDLAKAGGDEVPALVGERMAASSGLRAGDVVTLQWRDSRGTFDARDVRVVRVAALSVQSVDDGQLWVPLDRLREMAGMPGEATFVVLAPGEAPPADRAGWTWKDPDSFLADIREVVKGKTAGQSVLFLVLLSLAMLAIFDTQVLSIFRRRREIGTLVALGMTRGRVVLLFTLEGVLTGVLAAALAAAYGAPLMLAMARNGWTLPAGVDQFGIATGQKLFPVYGPALVAGTALLVLLVTTVVSWLPARRIAKLKPTDALRGRLA